MRKLPAHLIIMFVVASFGAARAFADPLGPPVDDPVAPPPTSPSPPRSCHGTIDGHVIDAISHEPVIGAVVAVDGNVVGFTDDQGRFEVRDLCRDEYTVSASRDDYAPTERDITVAGEMPIGLANTVAAVAGTGTLTVTLQHVPPINDVAVKTADLAQQVADDGLASIGGEQDASVDFDVTVP